ncbi:MAG: hypothetical protein C4531_01595 [Desulfurivibrio sp.]|nr:MAG: hypothetical protein C4531_01595 [Desulfurivibrio sp.]
MVMTERKIEIIAEIANAHQGDPDQARKLGEQAINAGADAIKFQIYSAEELLVQAHSRYQHFKNQAFSPEIWRDLLSYFILGKQATVYCDVFGLESYEIARSADAAGLKIHSSDLGNIPLLERVAASGKKIFLSCGGSNAREIATAIKVVGGKPAKRPILLHGFQSYPTAVEDSCLNRLGWLRKNFGSICDIGYMDHVAGDDPFATILPLVAIGMGATTLEKHITLNREAKGVDYYSSLNPDDFAHFVKQVRRCEAAIKSHPEQFAPSEKTYRSQVKKHWVTRSALSAGHVLGRDDLIMKRVANLDSHAADINKLLGRPLLHDCPEEHALSRAEVPATVWALVVARMRSSRLPGKALLDAAGLPALLHLFERLKQIKSLDRIVFCTTEEEADDPLVQLAAGAGIPFHRGPTDDVLSRMLGAITNQPVDLILRVTGDDILVDPDYAQTAIEYHLSMNAEYSDLKNLPSGTEVEIFDATLLKNIHYLAQDTGGTEYLTFYITHQKDQFATTIVPVAERHKRDWRLTLDTVEDYEVIKTFLAAMRAEGKALNYCLDDIVDFFSARPEVLEKNAMVRQRQAPIEVTTAINWSKFL